MNKIIPFNKEITFSSNIGEITSIALDDTLKLVDPYTIKGELIVRGCNKVFDSEEDFSYPLPVDITIDKKYDTSKCSVNIDDFYYEIINENILRVKIDLVLDDLFYKEEPIKNENIILEDDLIEDFARNDELTKDTKKEKSEILEKKSIIENTKDVKEVATDDSQNIKEEEEKVDKDNKQQRNDTSNKIEDLFKEVNEDKEYSIYRVYTVLANETLEMILDKYKVTKECLMNYNDLTNFQTGMKLVIPSVDE